MSILSQQETEFNDLYQQFDKILLIRCDKFESRAQCYNTFNVNIGVTLIRM
jgi:hypothetical protein